MKRAKWCPVLRHAVGMVGRTLKSYALLSVTIILSFSFLLGYLVYTDTELYNRYREIFSYRRGDVLIGDDSQDGKRLQLFLENLKELDHTGCYVYYQSLGGQLKTQYRIDGPGFPKDSQVELGNWQLVYLPDHAWPETGLVNFDSDITWIGEPRERFYLAEDEAVLCESVYRALGLDRVEDPVYTFRFGAGFSMTLRIAGYTREDAPITYSPVATNDSVYIAENAAFQLILSSKLIESATLGEDDLILPRRWIAVYSESPEQVVQLAKTMKYESVFSVYEEQNGALEAIRTEKKTKAVISMALLLLLGINLYSSFSNALNDRKFEIGVKRAIGASGWSIVRQFLYESILVMVVNVVISMVLVADLMIAYKYIYEHRPDEWGVYREWIVYISPYSLAMFGVCAVTLTLVFSLIFAYKSTRVEIVRYLKAE